MAKIKIHQPSRRPSTTGTPAEVQGPPCPPRPSPATPESKGAVAGGSNGMPVSSAGDRPAKVVLIQRKGRLYDAKHGHIVNEPRKKDPPASASTKGHTSTPDEKADAASTGSSDSSDEAVDIAEVTPANASS